MQDHGSRLVGLDGMAVRAVREVGAQLDLEAKLIARARRCPGRGRGSLTVKDRPVVQVREIDVAIAHSPAGARYLGESDGPVARIAADLGIGSLTTAHSPTVGWIAASRARYRVPSRSTLRRRRAEATCALLLRLLAALIPSWLMLAPDELDELRQLLQLNHQAQLSACPRLVVRDYLSSVRHTARRECSASAGAALTRARCQRVRR